MGKRLQFEYMNDVRLPLIYGSPVVPLEKLFHLAAATYFFVGRLIKLV